MGAWKSRTGARIAAVLVLIFIVVQACTTAPPVLAPRPPVPRAPGDTVIMAGPIYPLQSRMFNGFELDAPITPDPGAANAGRLYHGFEMNFRVAGSGTLELTWLRDPNFAMPMERVDGPCDSYTGADERALMEVRALRGAGIVAPASYNLEIDGRLAMGRALYWYTCHPDRPGEVSRIVEGDLVTDYNIAFLIPQLLVTSNARLSIVSTSLDGQVVSDPLTIPMVQSRLYFAAIGDSVVWAQGIPRGSSYSQQLFRDLVGRLGVVGAFRNFAHSGARINNPGDSWWISELDPADCGSGASLHGEVPRKRPTIQCQVLAAANTPCLVGPASGGIPAFDCRPSAVAGAPDGAVITTLDRRPRWDWVVMDGCINDIGARRVHLGENAEDFLDMAALISLIDYHCNVQKGLKDVRDFLPNAIIAYHGYHRTFSDHSLNGIRDACPAALFEGSALTTVLPINMLGRAVIDTAAGQRIADRSGLFQSQSHTWLHSSVPALNDLGNGIGKVVYVPFGEIFPPETAVYSPAELAYPLDCETPLLEPIDPVADERKVACAEQADLLSLPANSDTEESCKRASAFHPKLEAQHIMFEQIRKVLTDEGLYPP